jgi:hypothetical protein
MGTGDLLSPDVASLYPLLWLWFYSALWRRRMSTYLSTGNPTDYRQKALPPVHRSHYSALPSDKTHPRLLTWNAIFYAEITLGF